MNNKKPKRIFNARVVIIIFSVLVIISVVVCVSKWPEIKIALKPSAECEEVLPGVIDLGTYTRLNFDFAEYMIEKSTYQAGGACSATVKTLDNGEVVVGRNFDYFVCNYPVYIMRTKLEDCYETVGSAMMYDSPFQECDDAVENGVNNIAYQVLPFLVTDVMNSEGLYMEISMRHGETDENGKGIFLSSGTNPESEHRVFIASIPQYIALNCANIDEVLEYIKTLDIYSESEDESWGYGFMLADAAGRHGVLEISNNSIYWTEGQNYHTNFYIAEDLRNVQKYKIGTGRYSVLKKGYKAIHSENDLAKLMDSVSYRQVFSNNCLFDNRSEFAGSYPEWTYEYVTDPANADEIKKEMIDERGTINSKSRKEMTVEDDVWETTYRIIANLTDRTLTYKFFENDDYNITIGF